MDLWPLRYFQDTSEADALVPYILLGILVALAQLGKPVKIGLSKWFTVVGHEQRTMGRIFRIKEDLDPVPVACFRLSV